MRVCLQPQVPSAVQLRSTMACIWCGGAPLNNYGLPAKDQGKNARMWCAVSKSSVRRWRERTEEIGRSRMRSGLCLSSQGTERRALSIDRKDTRLCSFAGHPARLLQAPEWLLVQDLQADLPSHQGMQRLSNGRSSVQEISFSATSWCGSEGICFSEVPISVFLPPSWQQKSSVSSVIRPQFDPAPEVNPSISPGPSVPDPKLPPAEPSSWPSTPPEFRPDVAPLETPGPETIPSPNPGPLPEIPTPEVPPLEIPFEVPAPETVPTPSPSPEVPTLPPEMPNPSPSTWPSIPPPVEIPSPNPSIPEIFFTASGISSMLLSQVLFHPPKPCPAGTRLQLPLVTVLEPLPPSLLPPFPEVGFIQETGRTFLTGVPRGPPISPPNTPPLTPPGVPTPTPPPSVPPIPPSGVPPPIPPPQAPPIPPGEPGPVPPPTAPPPPPGGVPPPGPPEFPPAPSPGPEIFPPGPSFI